VDFALSPGGVLSFRNAAVDAAVAAPPADGYRAAWAQFDNRDRSTTPLGSPTAGGGDGIRAPSALPGTPGAFVRIAIAAVNPAQTSWAEPVEVYFRRTESAWSLVGVDRLR
jgi:hypothetical protein